MNIFLPYENDIIKSVQSLNDKRLIKQILECKQIYMAASGESQGYKNHPIVVHYKHYIQIVLIYGSKCCIEYFLRFRKHHKYWDWFNMCGSHTDLIINYIPFYAEYPKTDKRCIRTTENVSELYQKKLIDKWQNDKIEPKWTNRDAPEFYKKYLVEE